MKLKSFLSVIFCFIVLGCAGNTNIPETLNKISNPKNVSYMEGVETETGWTKRRNKNKALMKHISDRTVLIERDCSPKDDVVIVGTSNPQRRYDSWGSGVIVMSQNYGSIIFTANHVLHIDKNYRNHFQCEITIYKSEMPGIGDGYKAKVLKHDDAEDLGILYIEEDLGINTGLELDPFTGEDVWAAGFPYLFGSSDQSISITKGTLATKNVNMGRKGRHHRITSQVYFGNSGGGVWTKEGKLVGIVVILFGTKMPGMRTQAYEGYYYAKPVNDFVDLLD